MTYRRVRGAIDELEGALKALKVLDVETPGADASQLLQEMQSCTLEAPKERLHFFPTAAEGKCEEESMGKSSWRAFEAVWTHLSNFEQRLKL